MIALVLVLAAVALLVSLVTAASLIEVYEAVHHRGGADDIGDAPAFMDLAGAAGTAPSAHGLPRELDSGSGVVLFLSPSCPPCRDLAAWLGSSLPDSVHVVVGGADPEAGRAWIGEFGLPLGGCTVDGSISERLGLDLTPVAVVVRDGRLDRALTVPSPEWLSSLVAGVAA